MEKRMREHKDIAAPGKIFPFAFAEEVEDKQDLGKMQLFGKGLAKELKPNDTIENAVTKIVRMALAAEFGPSLVKSKGADTMVNTIVQAVMCDQSLRKQALLIIDRYLTQAE